MNQQQTLLTEAHSGQSQSLFHMTTSGHDTMIKVSITTVLFRRMHSCLTCM